MTTTGAITCPILRILNGPRDASSRGTPRSRTRPPPKPARNRYRRDDGTPDRFKRHRSFTSRKRFSLWSDRRRWGCAFVAAISWAMSLSGIVQIAEQARTRQARLTTQRSTVLGRHGAEAALVHRARLLVEHAHLIGAGGHAVLAADAAPMVNLHDAVRADVSRTGRAHRGARRVLAVHALQRNRLHAHGGVRARLLLLVAMKSSLGRRSFWRWHATRQA